MADYIDTGVIPEVTKFKIEREGGGTNGKITKVTMRTISDLSEDPREAIQMVEMMAYLGIIIHIEDLGTIDETPAGKQLLNTLASMLG